MSDLFKFKFDKKPVNTGQSPSAKIEENMSDEVFRSLRELIYKLSGIYFQESKKYLVESRIKKRLAILKLTNFEDYYKLLNSMKSREELNQLFVAVTINETYFFRAEPQFVGFEKTLLPEIISLKKNEEKPVVRIWSAASSTGEEAYTAAIIIKEKLQPKYPDVDFQIIATDININVLETAKAGIYKEYAIKHIPKEYFTKYFTEESGNFMLSDEIKKMVKFQQLNLYDTMAMRAYRNMDIIFCCNVLMYFDFTAKQKVLQSLYDSLSKDGYMFIGYAESLHGVMNSFKLIHLDKAMVYKKINNL